MTLSVIFIRTIFSVPFCSYHFVQYHFVRIPFCPYHFVRTICPLPFCPRTHVNGCVFFTVLCISLAVAALKTVAFLQFPVWLSIFSLTANRINYYSVLQGGFVLILDLTS